jgi:hypothetical protein
VWIGVVLVLVAAACGGGSGGNEEPGTEGRVVASSDGVVEIAVPDGVATDVDLTITPVDNLSEPIAAAASDGLIAREYDLGPDGTEFAEPVTVTFHLDAGDLGLAPGELPFAVLVSGSDGEFEGYEDVLIERTEDTVAVSGETSHFSKVAVLVGGVGVEMTPNGASADVGFYFNVTIEVGELAAFGLLSDISETVRYEFFGGAPYLRVPDDASGEIGPGALQTASTDIRCVLETPEATLVEYGAELSILREKLLPEAHGIRLTTTKTITGRIVGLAICDPLSEPPPTTATTTTTTMPDLGALFEGSDPTGDFYAAAVLMERGFEAFEAAPPAGLDITNVAVTYAPGGSQTIVTVTFAGDGRSLEEEAGRAVTITPGFRRGGEYLFDAYHSRESSFLSSGPEGATLSVEWLSDSIIQFTIDGFVPMAGDRVRVEVFSRFDESSGGEVAGDEAGVDVEG